MCVASISQAATLVPIVPYPGSIATRVFGINDNNVVAGGYLTSDGNEHGFYGMLDGQYTSFDKPQAYVIEGRGINNANEIVGYYQAKFGFLFGFERLADGTIKTIKQGNTRIENGFAEGINSKGQFVASGNMDGEGLSCVGKNGKCRKDSLISGRIWYPRGINDHRVVVGFGTPHAYVLKDGNATQVDYPGAYWTFLYGINDQGVATGSWTEQDLVTSHALVYDISTGLLQSLDVSGLHNTFAVGINKSGLVVLGSDEGYFIYCMKRKTCPQQGAEIPNSRPIRSLAVTQH